MTCSRIGDTPSWNDADAARWSTGVWRVPRRTLLFRGRMADARRDRRPPRAAAGRPAEPVPIAPWSTGRCRRTAATAIRQTGMPPLREAWRRGLAAIEAEAQARHGRAFAHAGGERIRMRLLRASAAWRGAGARWQGMPAAHFFTARAAARHRRGLLRPSRRPGARSASAARPARAAMFAWASTAAIPGKR